MVDVCCICIHDLLLHSHLHSWFSFAFAFVSMIHIHDSHSWFAFAWFAFTFTCMLHWHSHSWFAFVMCICMYVHKPCFNIYACVHAYLYMYLCNNTSNKDLMCMHQTTLDYIVGNISRMHMCICNVCDGEKVGVNVVWLFPWPTLVWQQTYA